MGLSPADVYVSPLRSNVISSDRTPLHVASALLAYGGDTHRELAVSLTTPRFLRQAYSKSTDNIDRFVQSAVVNPTSPEDFGLQKLKAADFLLLGSSPLATEVIVVDSLGCGSWFEQEYVDQVLRSSQPAKWLPAVRRLHAAHKGWEAAVHRGAQSRLTTAERMAYTDRARFLNEVLPHRARGYLSAQTGAAQVLWAAFTDATPEEMAKGLRVLATENSSSIISTMEVLGRALTYEDLSQLTPLQTLRVLHRAPMDAIREVCATHAEALGSRLFSLTSDPTQLRMVTNCMSPHGDRTARWRPGGAARYDNKYYPSTTTPPTWGQNMKEMVRRYQLSESWRNELLEAATPATAFLALLPKGVEERIKLPEALLESTLRSCENISTVREIVERTPSWVFPHMEKKKPAQPEPAVEPEAEVA
jgi:hypothetical protein